MEYKKTVEFGWTSDDGNIRVQIYKDNFWPKGAIMIQIGDRWVRQGIEQWLRQSNELHEIHSFPYRIGRLAISHPLVIEHEGWKPLFWRFHWKIK